MRVALSAAYADPAYVACLGSAIHEAEALLQFCRIYAAAPMCAGDSRVSRHVATLSGGRACDLLSLPRSPADTAGGFSIHRAVRAPIARTDRQCACVCD